MALVLNASSLLALVMRKENLVSYVRPSRCVHACAPRCLRACVGVCVCLPMGERERARRLRY